MEEERKSETKMVEIVYAFNYSDGKRKATIHYNTETGSLIKCVYWGVKDMYTLQDWKFINELSSEIIRLSGESIQKKG